MKLAYYPGCTLKTKAKNLEDSAIAALNKLGISFGEMPRWNCCGAVFSLADDDLIHHAAPVRNLIRAMQEGADTIITICSQCYNTLARANQLMREDEEKRDTLNRFMDEEPDYSGEVEVIHYLSYLREHYGWEALRKEVVKPLAGLKVAPFYGCTLLRPTEVAVGGPSPTIYQELIEVLGAEAVEWAAAEECCGSYQVLANPDGAAQRLTRVLQSANSSGADALMLSCPLCEYNLGTRQASVLEECNDLSPVPTYYFTQLLAIALGLEPEVCHFDLNGEAALQLLQSKDYVAPAAV
jgi:heterodisulfide reductase subunit B